MRILKIFVMTVLAILLLVGAVAGIGWYFIKGEAVDLEKSYVLFVSRDSNFETVTKELEDSCGLKNPEVFSFIAEKMNVPGLLRPGKFEIKPGMSNRDIALTLRQGSTLTADIVIRGSLDVRVIPKLLADKLEPDIADFEELLNDDKYLSELGFDKKTISAMFIPNTYNMYWFTSAEEVYERINKEYKNFWNSDRLSKAKEIGLSPIEVSILASIVDKETNQVSEMQQVAGVYMNRLNTKGWKLQADPTVKFAMDSSSLTRVLLEHTKIEHPYNTYFIDGLPPGPICIPSVQAIDAVLNYTKSNYMFFCAKPDLSGFHVFARTLNEHNKNAAAYSRFITKWERENKK